MRVEIEGWEVGACGTSVIVAWWMLDVAIRFHVRSDGVADRSWWDEGAVSHVVERFGVLIGVGVLRLDAGEGLAMAKRETRCKKLADARNVPSLPSITNGPSCC